MGNGCKQPLYLAFTSRWKAALPEVVRRNMASRRVATTVMMMYKLYQPGGGAERSNQVHTVDLHTLFEGPAALFFKSALAFQLVAKLATMAATCSLRWPPSQNTC